MIEILVLSSLYVPFTLAVNFYFNLFSELGLSLYFISPVYVCQFSIVAYIMNVFILVCMLPFHKPTNYEN